MRSVISYHSPVHNTYLLCLFLLTSLSLFFTGLTSFFPSFYTQHTIHPFNSKQVSTYQILIFFFFEFRNHRQPDRQPYNIKDDDASRFHRNRHDPDVT
ncbi:hypothetical protein GGR55DRAFT_600032 [Xylaria sp. FL0064]|nr:hypothetical protein GGR55DRAFT_600032 [Xylaria sp. FL0064]